MLSARKATQTARTKVANAMIWHLGQIHADRCCEGGTVMQMCRRGVRSWHLSIAKRTLLKVYCVPPLQVPDDAVDR